MTRLRSGVPHASFGRLRRAAGLRLRMCHARLLFDADAVVDAFAGGEKRLPRDAGRILDPRFLRLGVAAGRLALLEHGAAGLAQARVDVAQFVLAFDLDAEMIEPGLPATRRDGEIDARIV